MYFKDVAQGNFSEEIVVPPELPARKEGSATKDQDPLRPELPSTTTCFHVTFFPS